jgi:hypothetical protein
MIDPCILEHIAACARGDQRLMAATTATLTACGVDLRASMPRGSYGITLHEEILRVVAFHAAAQETDEMLEVLSVVARRWFELSQRSGDL